MTEENMNILFITQDDPFYVRCFFDEFLRVYRNANQIQAVVIQKPLGRKSTWTFLKQMYAFYGLNDFFKMGFRFVQTKTLNQLGYFFRNPEWLDMKQLCQARNIEVIYENHIHQPEFLDKLRQWKIDLIISVAAPTIFKQELIDIPRLGCINIHHAPLPRYRGMMPNFWQLYYGEKTVGITIHKISPKIDEGEIILQRQVLINPSESLDGLIKRTKRLGAHYMAEAIEMIRHGRVRYKKNRAEEGAYFSFPTREDVHRFRSMGHRLI